jgi:uncharacterized membrane protein
MSLRIKISLAAFLGAGLLFAGQALHYAPLLPLRMASHFGAGGAPNGWMERGYFIDLNLGIAGLLTLVFLSVCFKLRSLDVASMNLPNKEYWMAPERRQETADTLTAYFLGFGTATLLLMLDVFHQVFRFNLAPSAALDHPLTSLGVYLAFTLLWMAGFFRRCAKK